MLAVWLKMIDPQNWMIGILNITPFFSHTWTSKGAKKLASLVPMALLFSKSVLVAGFWSILHGLVVNSVFFITEAHRKYRIIPKHERFAASSISTSCRRQLGRERVAVVQLTLASNLGSNQMEIGVRWGLLNVALVVFITIILIVGFGVKAQLISSSLWWQVVLSICRTWRGLHTSAGH